MRISLPEDLRYVAIDGIPGAGASRLAAHLSKRMHARLVQEDCQENPFLARFHADRSRWAFQTQLAFLIMRYRQQKVIHARDLFHRLVIADYTFDKDRIYAHMNLSGDELALYDRLYRTMDQETPRPDMVVFLQSGLSRALQCIMRRNRHHALDRSYLSDLREAYTAHYFRYRKSPLLIVNAEDFGDLDRPDELDELVLQIARSQRSGTTYFRPISPTTHSED